MHLKYLAWDSVFFDKKIGEVNCKTDSKTELFLLLEQAKSEKYQLVYVYSNDDYAVCTNLLSEYGARLVDIKVVFKKTLLPNQKSENCAQEYLSNDLTIELESLAYFSGYFSRFRVDLKFGKDAYFNLYKTWLTKSLSNEIADKVYVIKELDKIIAFITLKMSDEVGKIGLLSVSELHQGKGYGKKLIDSCINTLLKNGIYEIEVTTQMANLSGCRFYEKCGFSTSKLTSVYHFWL